MLNARHQRLLCIGLYVVILGVFVCKHFVDFGERADAMAFAGGPFASFDLTVRFPSVEDELAKRVRVGDCMTVHSSKIAEVIGKSIEARGDEKSVLLLQFRSPNWLRCYFEPRPGVEVIFTTDAYSLKGQILRTFL
ncbi:hypothetical protein J7M28_05985 [bacterium]|nr:hypothetical protein [bacterium]